MIAPVSRRQFVTTGIAAVAASTSPLRSARAATAALSLREGTMRRYDFQSIPSRQAIAISGRRN